VASRPEDCLLLLLVPAAERGQREFARALRTHAMSLAPELCGLLGADDDAAFLEPMGFVYKASGSRSVTDLATVYAGALPPAERTDLNVLSDGRGRVFLPGRGYLKGLTPNTELYLIASEEEPIGYRSSISTSQSVALKDWRIDESRLSLLPYPVVALDHQVRATGARLCGIEHASLAHRKTLTSSMRLLASAWPSLADAINRVVRHAVLFEDADQNSFSLPAAHGIVFINVSHGQTEAYFAEDLAHQSGHVLFTAVWAGSEPLVTISPETKVEQLVGREDHRTLEAALHGMVTQALMVGALDRLTNLDTDLDEVRGRLYFALVRLGTDLRALAGLDIFTGSGIAILRELVATYSDIARRHREAILASDLRDQPYNFDYDLYRARNASVMTRTRS
jgi:hypothetical protein